VTTDAFAPTDQRHRSALADCQTKADMIRYACDTLGKPSTVEVQRWLRLYGVGSTRSYASQTVNRWRAEKLLTDTADRPVLTPEMIAELDAIEAGADLGTGGGAQDAVPVDGPGVVVVEATANVPPAAVDLTGRVAVPAAPGGPRHAAFQPDTAQPDTARAVWAEGAWSQAARARPWALAVLALPAFVAIWAGWVGLGKMCGFGEVYLLPGILDRVRINSAITLPIGVEAYAAFGLRVWLGGGFSPRARRYARWSAIGSLTLGMAGQVAYHLMTAVGRTQAPWEVTLVVSCLPVLVLGAAAALWHICHQPAPRPAAGA
jgi:hypothetical protein